MRTAFLNTLQSIVSKQGDNPWIDITAGLPEDHSSIHNLVADPKDTNVFYAMNNYGIYRLAKDAGRWEKLEINWKEKYLNQRPSCFNIKVT